MMKEEKKEKEEKEEKDMLREKSNNPNLKGGEKQILTDSWSWCSGGNPSNMCMCPNKPNRTQSEPFENA